MPRRKLTPLEIIQQAAQSLGLDAPAFDTSQLDESRREADSVILYIERPDLFREAECRHCGRLFATNYSAVAMCKDSCRIAHLRSLGIEWNPAKSQEERWANRIPLVVGPNALEVVKQCQNV